jgi:hypothetical protein
MLSNEAGVLPRGRRLSYCPEHPRCVAGFFLSRLGFAVVLTVAPARQLPDVRGGLRFGDGYAVDAGPADDARRNRKIPKSCHTASARRCDPAPYPRLVCDTKREEPEMRWAGPTFAGR